MEIKKLKTESLASLIISEIERISVVAGVWHHVASHHHIGGIVA